MLLTHLKEAKAKLDFSPIGALEKLGVVNTVCYHLTELGGAEAVLARVIKNNFAKNHDTAPEKILDLIDPLLDCVDNLDDKNPHGHDGAQQIGLLLDRFAEALMQLDEKSFEAAIKRFNTAKFVPRSAKLNRDFKLRVTSAGRSKDQKNFDKTNDTFVFVGRDAFKEVPKDSGNFKKTLEIERLMKVDRASPESHDLVAKLKFRAQVSDGRVYIVDLPKGTLKDGIGGEEIPDDLIYLINQHKRPVTH